jgi:isopenicillin-N epimerase
MRLPVLAVLVMVRTAGCRYTRPKQPPCGGSAVLAVLGLAYASSATAASAREVTDSATPRRTDVATDDAAAATGGGAARRQLSTPRPQFGHALRKKWYFTDNFTDMNHGFGGITPRVVHEAQQRYVVRRESNPSQWGWGCPTGSDVQAAREKVADFVGAASAEELVLVENAMGGINAVMRSWPGLGRGDTIMLLSIGYDGFYNVYSWLQETLGVELLVVPLAFPLHDREGVLGPVREALRVNGSRITVAVFSHIASMPVVINPVAELAELCHNHTAGRIPVVIDGAHVPGQIPLNVSEIGAEAYIGDLHKWMYSPKGSAFIHVAQNATNRAGVLLHERLQPTTTCSDLATDGTLAGRFNYVGTRDYTAYCAVNDAFAFRESAELGGHAAIMSYIRSLARRGGELLTKMWGTYTLVPASMQPGMTNPVLPCHTSASCSYLTTNLTNVSDLWFSGDQLPSPGQKPSQWCTSTRGLMVYWRLSAQVYLEMSDFERLGRAVLNRTTHATFRNLERRYHQQQEQEQEQEQAAAANTAMGVGEGDEDEEEEEREEEERLVLLAPPPNGGTGNHQPHHQQQAVVLQQGQGGVILRDERVLHTRRRHMGMGMGMGAHGATATATAAGAAAAAAAADSWVSDDDDSSKGLR